MARAVTAARLPSHGASATAAQSASVAFVSHDTPAPGRKPSAFPARVRPKYSAQVSGHAEEQCEAQVCLDARAAVAGGACVPAARDQRPGLPCGREGPAGRCRLQQGADDLLRPAVTVVSRVGAQQGPGAALELARGLAHAVLGFRPGSPATVFVAGPVTIRAASAIRIASARSAAAPPSVSP